MSTNGNGPTDYFYDLEGQLNTQECNGFLQMSYTSDDASENTTHEAVDYFSDFMGSLTTELDGATTVRALGILVLQISVWLFVRTTYACNYASVLEICQSITNLSRSCT